MIEFNMIGPQFPLSISGDLDPRLNKELRESHRNSQDPKSVLLYETIILCNFIITIMQIVILFGSYVAKLRNAK